MDENPNMMERARGFKRIFETVTEECQEDINPELFGDKMPLNVTVITEWVDPMTGRRTLMDYSITDGGEGLAPPWTAKGLLIESFQQYDKVRGRA